MKARLRYLGLFFGITLATFLLMKVVFMLYNSAANAFALGDVFSVLWHGLPLDLSTTSYLTVLPWLFSMLGEKWRKPLTKYYCILIAPLLALILVADTVLYEFWQFKLDATIFNYIGNPTEALASVSAWFVILALLAVAALTAAQLWTYRKVLKCKSSEVNFTTSRLYYFATLLLLSGLLFLLIRGGVGRSTMNVGRVYYSQNQFLNHSAVNPAFSLLSSAFKVQRFDKLYRYYEPAECDSLFARMQYSTESIGSDSLLTTKRPTIVLLVLEGFGGSFVGPLGGNPAIAPNFNKLCSEGIFFTNCYANSFRTDRGLVCTLSGYPAFPDISVMKLPEKSRTLPSIARSLAANGYNTQFLYGGDINFTNTKGYLLSTGYQLARGYETFPASIRHDHSWGVNDHVTLDTLYNIIVRSEELGVRSENKPQTSNLKANYFITCLTLSSHEDWQVPYHRIPGDQVANAMAYLDDCIGKFVNRLKGTPLWDNLLLVILPDHGITYPRGITEANPERNHIPVLWIGGAVKEPRSINTLCNQTDLAATLLGQLAIDHHDFTYSRDILSQTYTYPLALHTFSGGITFIDSTGYTVEDLNASKIISQSGRETNTNFQSPAHAYLQHTMQDFSNR